MADLCRKIGVGERLEHDFDARIEASLVNDRVSGVARRIKDFEPRLPSQRLFGELATIHAEPEVLEKWLTSHKLSSARLDQMMDEYKRLWATGSMKDPSIISSDREMRMK